jgi:hypothetical protein
MGAAVLIPLIVQEAPQLIDWAVKLFQLLSSKTPPTQADWDHLSALADVTASQQMQAALNRAGIDQNSAQGQALLALVPK